MNILSLCGMKYYNELRNNFDTDNRWHRKKN
jgi:hypothetical protein